MATANVYVDGFNLYYEIKKRFPECRWLDLRSFASALFPHENINRVRYFTANVRAKPTDPDQRQRQQTYLRALRTVDVDIHLGRFKKNRRPMKRAVPCGNPTCTGSEIIEVIHVEEKSTDVALGAYLLRDSYEREMDTAIVITNDTDLRVPLEIARDECGIRIALVSPQSTVNHDLEVRSDIVRKLSRRRPLWTAQFPEVLHDAAGEFHKPPAWP